MYEECGQHQIDFIRRDSERLFKHGERMIETASNLSQQPAAGLIGIALSRIRRSIINQR